MWRAQQGQETIHKVTNSFHVLRLIVVVIVICVIAVMIVEEVREWYLSRDPILIHVTEVLVLQTICESSSAKEGCKSKGHIQKFHCQRLRISNTATMNPRSIISGPLAGM